MKKLLQNPLFIIAAGVGVYLLLRNTGSSSRDDKRQFLRSQGLSITDTTNMSPSQIDDVYKYVTDYVLKGQKEMAPADLLQRIQDIGDQFNIFT